MGRRAALETLMNDQQTKLGASAKKWIILVLAVIAVGLFSLFVLVKGSPRGAKIIGEGDVAPDFRLTSLDGRQVNLFDYRGKVVMLHFWATWCPPCVEEIPTIDRLFRGSSGKDFEILAVSVDEGGADAVGAFLSRTRLTLPVLLDPRHDVSSLYGTFKFPETYLIDRQGVVRYKVIGPRDWSSPDGADVITGLLAQK